MTRDEFMLQRLKDDRVSYRRTYPIILGCVIGFVALSIYAFVTGKPAAGVGGILTMTSIALYLPYMKERIGSFDDAIRELEAHIADPSVPLSESTKDAIAASDYPTFELLKGWIGLSIIAILLLMMGILLGWLSEGEQTMLVVLSAGSVMGSIAVFFPAARLYRSWKTARALDKTSL